MRPVLIVRNARGNIASMVEVSNLDERHVQSVISDLRVRYPAPFVIDDSQVKAARLARLFQPDLRLVANY